MSESVTIRVGCVAAPVAGATVTLFDSTATFPGCGLAMMGIDRIRFDFAGLDQPSAASGLIGYKSNDKGTTWYPSAFSASGSAESLPCTVDADTGSDGDSYEVFIGTPGDVKFTFTASGTAPTTGWPPCITLVEAE